MQAVCTLHFELQREYQKNCKIVCGLSMMSGLSVSRPHSVPFFLIRSLSNSLFTPRVTWIRQIKELGRHPRASHE